MQQSKAEFLTVWGDTVDFKQLIIGLTLGAIFGYVSFIGGLQYLKLNHASLSKGLLMGYALLFGVAGCVLVGVVAAMVFKPKRIFHEEDFHINGEMVFQELGIDQKQEAEFLKDTPKEVIEEMHKLQIYHLFAEKTCEEERK
jgi:hypothetical protein